MLKYSYKSRSTNSLYEFAEELASFDKTSASQKKDAAVSANKDTKSQLFTK